MGNSYSNPKGLMRHWGSGRSEKKPIRNKKKERPPYEEKDEEISENNCSEAGSCMEFENREDLNNEGNVSQSLGEQKEGKGIPIAPRDVPCTPESTSYNDEFKPASSSPEQTYMYNGTNQERVTVETTPDATVMNEEAVTANMTEHQNCNEQMESSVADDSCNTSGVQLEEEASTSNETPEEHEDSPLTKDVITIVSKNIGRDWRKLAWQLLLDVPEVDSIVDHASNYGLEEMAREVLQRWQQKMPTKATITTLSANLEAIGRTDIAVKIKSPTLELWRNSLTSTTSNASSSGSDSIAKQTDVLEAVQTYLKEDYWNLGMKGLPWIQDLVLTLEEYYVDLIMKIDERGPKSSQELKIEEIFTPTKLEKKPIRILIEGGPGSGKTTLAAKLAYDWAKGQSYISHFDLVVFLPLRLFEGNWDDTLSKASAVGGLEKYYFLKLVKEESLSMLFILDGYDEASHETEEEILPLIQKGVYTKSTVIITSRPGKFTPSRDGPGNEKFLAKADVVPKFGRFLDKRVTVKGFNETQQTIFIEKHVRSFSDEQKCNIKSKFANMVDKEVLTCPLFLLMLLVLFTSEEDVENTETKTGLYKQVFNFVIKRYLAKNVAVSVDDVDLFSCKHGDKPPYIELMRQFGEFSLKILNRSCLTISKKEIVNTYKCDPKILELGFLTQYVSLKGFREHLLYEPVHKSLLEFAAAYGVYLSFDSSQGFSSSEEIIKFRPTETTSLFFPFLVGLMGDNAGVLFNILHSYAFEYSCKFDRLYHSLLETNVSEPILNALTPFLPPEWNIYSDPSELKPGANNFHTSSQHEALVGWGVHKSKIRQINWDILQDTCLPTGVIVDTLVLDMRQVEHINNLFEIIKQNSQYNVWQSSQNKLHCKYLWCSFSDSVCSEGMPLDGFFDLLNLVDFQLISFDFTHSCIDDLSQRQSHDVLKHVCTAIKTGKLKRVHLHSMSKGTYSSNPNWIHPVNDLVHMDRIEVLELCLEGMTQVEIDQFMMYATESINLRTVVLSTTLPEADVEKLPFTVNLEKLCDKGRKSWKWVELSAIRLDCSETSTASFLIEHLEISSCSVSSAANKLLVRCCSKSINCVAALLNNTWSQWSCQACLTELNISIDSGLMYRGLSSLTEKLRNIQILALTMTSCQQHKTSLPIEEWISNAMSCLRLKGLEIWRFSKNTDTATAMVEGLIKCLEEQPSATVCPETHPQNNSLPSLQPSMKKLHMEYLMVNDMEEGQHALNYLQRLKNCLRHKSLQRLEMVLSTGSKLSEDNQTSNIFSKYSINQAFPRLEGFRVEHDLWGSRENDSIYSRGKHRISRKQKDRISITFKQTLTIRRGTVA